MGKKLKKGFVLLLPYAIWGVVGFYLGKLISQVIDGNITIRKALLYVMIFIIAFIISGFIHVIIHELGHLVMGLLSGYTVVFFRVGNRVIVRDKDKFKIKKFSLPGTGGQCLMSPPEYNNGNYYFTIYLLGGVIANLVLSLVAISILHFAEVYFEVMLMAFIVAGINLTIINRIPQNLNGVDSDIKTLIELRRSPIGRQAFWLQLYIMRLQVEGKGISDIPLEYMKISPELNYDSAIECSMYYLNCMYYFELRDFDTYKKLVNKVLEINNNMLPLHKNELICELIFLEIINSCNKDVIDNLFTSDIKEYIARTSEFLSRIRLKYGYELLMQRNDEVAELILKKFEKVSKTWPFQNDIKSELSLIELIKDKHKYFDCISIRDY